MNTIVPFSSSSSEERALVSLEESYEIAPLSSFLPDEERSLISVEELASIEECYKIYCECMRSIVQMEKVFAGKIAEIEESTEELVFWREDVLASSLQRIERTQELIAYSENWEIEALEALRENRELEWTNLQNDVEDAETEEKDLEKELLAKKELLDQKQSAAAQKAFENHQLQAALRQARG